MKYYTLFHSLYFGTLFSLLYSYHVGLIFIYLENCQGINYILVVSVYPLGSGAQTEQISKHFLEDLEGLTSLNYMVSDIGYAVFLKFQPTWQLTNRCPTIARLLCTKYLSPM